MIYLIFAANLLLTCLSEGVFIYLLYRKKEYVYYSFLCNMLTNPALNLLVLVSVSLFGTKFYTISVVVLELTAILIEAFVYRLLCGLKAAKALLLSGFLNAVSFALGLALTKGT